MHILWFFDKVSVMCLLKNTMNFNDIAQNGMKLMKVNECNK